MNSMLTVMKFTIRNKLYSKSYIITTLIIALLMALGANAPYLIQKLTGNSEPTKVGYIEGQHSEITQGLADYFAGQEEPDVALVAIPPTGSEDSDIEALKQAIKEGKIKGYITFKENAEVGFPDVTYSSEKLLESSTSQALQGALQMVKTNIAVSDAKLTESQQKKLFAPVSLTSVQISLSEDEGTGKSVEEQATAIGLTYVIIILLFMAIMITGTMIATEITAEKSSRVMEILVTSVAPLKQMFGKIIGTFIAGLTQLVVLGAVLAANLSLPQNKDAFASFGIRLDSIDPLLLVFAVFFYLAGYFLFATLFAALGSMASRTEDMNQVVMPVSMLMLIGFYIAIYGLSNPDSPLVVVCSFVPFFAPFLMFLRIGLSDPLWWETTLSIVLLLATTGLLGWLSAKIYRTGILMYGKRPTIKELLKAMKAYKV
ncbi:MULTISPECIES: ABC transporter permease [Cohnella]|uniref:ABC transporter permease n=1 Tax=Cohnella TaxID=329857 RepID=UPI00037ABD79|nr:MULTISPECIES: ABC transporter permease [Cohnella]REK64368.1 MAG: ABC transporter permease [Cohnella sp.]